MLYFRPQMLQCWPNHHRQGCGLRSLSLVVLELGPPLAESRRWISFGRMLCQLRLFHPMPGQEVVQLTPVTLLLELVALMLVEEHEAVVYFALNFELIGPAGY
jgi:hypothetical protein